MDIKAAVDIWEHLRYKAKHRLTYPYHIYRGKGQDGGVTGRVGCFACAFFEVLGYDEGFWGAGYQDLDLVHRLELFVGDKFKVQLINGKTFKQQCHNAGAAFYRLLFLIRDSNFSIPNDPTAASIQDRKSWDDAKIVNCSPETKAFGNWGRVATANTVLAGKGVDNPKPWLRNKPGKIGFPVLEHAGPAAWGSNAEVTSKYENVWTWAVKCVKDAEVFSSAGGCAPAPSSSTGGCAPGPSASTRLPPPAPLPHRKIVKIFSFGLAKTIASFGQLSSEDLLKAYKDPRAASMREHNDKELIGLWKRGTKHAPNAGVMLVNAMGFHDPASKKETDGHVGHHPLILKALLTRPDILKRCCQAVRRGLAQCTQDVLEVLVFCRSGRHRSVALAECMSGALAADLSVIGRPEVHHLSAGHWDRMRNWCGLCNLCNPTGSESRQAKDAGVEGMLAEGNLVRGHGL